MTASNATEEQRLALREALKGQISNMRALQAAAEKDKQEQQELLARIAAMEGKVGIACVQMQLHELRCMCGYQHCLVCCSYRRAGWS
jgi:hypothetical protein